LLVLKGDLHTSSSLVLGSRFLGTNCEYTLYQSIYRKISKSCDSIVPSDNIWDLFDTDVRRNRLFFPLASSSVKGEHFSTLVWIRQLPWHCCTSLARSLLLAFTRNRASFIHSLLFPFFFARTQNKKTS